MRIFKQICVKVFCSGLMCAGIWAQDAELGKNMKGIEGIRWPIEHYENGRVKTQLIAERVENVTTAGVEVSRMIVQFYDENGRTNLEAHIDGCIYDSKEGKAVSQSDVRIEKDNIVITGHGFDWDAGKRMFRIFRKVRVVLTHPARKSNIRDLADE